MTRLRSASLQILPLVGLRPLEEPRAVAIPMAHDPGPVTASVTPMPEDHIDTIIVPALKEGFEQVFLGENAWRAIRISGGMIPKIKYIAAYRSQPISAITHVAPVESIVPYGEGGKYMLRFSQPAKPIDPIPFGDAPPGSMQGPRYTSLARLQAARSVADLIKPF